MSDPNIAWLDIDPEERIPGPINKLDCGCHYGPVLLFGKYQGDTTFASCKYHDLQGIKPCHICGKYQMIVQWIGNSLLISCDNCNRYVTRLNTQPTVVVFDEGKQYD